MIDPSNALESFQHAHQRGLIRLEHGILDPALFLCVDQPNGETRFSYVRFEGKTVAAFVEFVTLEPINGVPCFAIGYAVPQAFRKQGRAKDVVSAAIAELQHGLGRYGAFYIEAVVGTDNLASQHIAEHLISNAPVSIKDKHSGLPALQYVRKIEPPKAP